MAETAYYATGVHPSPICVISNMSPDPFKPRSPHLNKNDNGNPLPSHLIP